MTNNPELVVLYWCLLVLLSIPIYMAGKSYEVVSVGAKEPDATVFLPSESGASAGMHFHGICIWERNVMHACDVQNFAMFLYQNFGNTTVSLKE